VGKSGLPGAKLGHDRNQRHEIGNTMVLRNAMSVSDFAMVRQWFRVPDLLRNGRYASN